VQNLALETIVIVRVRRTAGDIGCIMMVTRTRMLVAVVMARHAQRESAFAPHGVLDEPGQRTGEGPREGGEKVADKPMPPATATKDVRERSRPDVASRCG
jgi:hypothetical protein